MPFDGETYDADRDKKRLSTQFVYVRDWFLKNPNTWITLKSLALGYGKPDALPGISARYRDLKKEKFGGYVMEKRYIKHGVWEYRMPMKIIQPDLFDD